MICTQCGYEHVDVHRTGEAMITYCQQCGHTTEVKRDPPRERWPQLRSPLTGKQAGGGAIAKLIPLPDKKRRHGR